MTREHGKQALLRHLQAASNLWCRKHAWSACACSHERYRLVKRPSLGDRHEEVAATFQFMRRSHVKRLILLMEEGTNELYRYWCPLHGFVFLFHNCSCGYARSFPLPSVGSLDPDIIGTIFA